MNQNTNMEMSQLKSIFRRISKFPPILAIRKATGNISKSIFIKFACIALIGWSIYYVADIQGRLFSSTTEILVGAPKIYSKERLINDRLTEKFWLHKQLEHTARNTPNTYSASSNTKLSAHLGSTSGEQSTSDDKNKNFIVLQNQLNDFLNSQKTRRHIRNAILDNELDDSHDIGAHALLSLSFNASILATQNSTKPTRIEILAGINDGLKDITETSDSGTCKDLKLYECAFASDNHLINSTVIDDSTENLDIAEAVVQYKKWRDLYNEWLRYETNKQQGELQETDSLLQSTDTTELAISPLNIFFKKANVRANEITTLLSEHAFKPTTVREETNQEITSKIPLCNIRTFEHSDNHTSTNIQNLSFTLKEDILNCVKYFESSIQHLDLELVKEHIASNPSKTIPEHSFATLKKLLDDYDRSVVVDLYARSLLETLPRQCGWRNMDKLVVQKSTAFISSKNVVAQEASDFTKDTEPVLKLADNLVEALYQCVLALIVRDFGTHALSSVHNVEGRAVNQRQSQTLYENRNFRSNYSFVGNVDDIVVRSNAYDFIPTAQMIYLINEPDDLVLGSPSLGAAMPRTGGANSPKQEGWDEKKLNATCEKDRLETSNWKNSISGNPPKAQSENNSSKGPDHDSLMSQGNPIEGLSAVDSEIGSAFLSLIYCGLIDNNSNQKNENVRRQTKLTQILIPTGLFRFIEALSESTEVHVHGISPYNDTSLEHAESSGEFSIDSSHRENSPATTATSAHALPNLRGKKTTSKTLRHQNIQGYSHPIANASPNNHLVSDNLAIHGYTSIFGWNIMPSKDSLFGLKLPRIESRNVALSAIVSVPPWLDSLNIGVSTGSLDPTSLEYSEIKSNYPRANIEAKVPRNLDHITDFLTKGVQLKPKVEKLRIQNYLVNACTKAEIVIEGTRLWRSSFATLGSQTSSLIQTLPDMNGIVVTFENVEPGTPRKFPAETNTESKIFLDVPVPLMVWTNEGRIEVSDSVLVRTHKSLLESPAINGNRCRIPKPSVEAG